MEAEMKVSKTFQNSRWETMIGLGLVIMKVLTRSHSDYIWKAQTVGFIYKVIVEHGRKKSIKDDR